jgi:hypothetical protein
VCGSPGDSRARRSSPAQRWSGYRVNRLFTLDSLRLFDPVTGNTVSLPALPSEVPVRPMVRSSDDTLMIWGASRDNPDETNDGFLLRL